MIGFCLTLIILVTAALAVIVQLAGLACLILGYRQSNRRTLLLAALLLWAGA